VQRVRQKIVARICRLHLQQIAMNIWKQLLLRRKQQLDSLALFGSLSTSVKQ
jgi:hypothetical protein